MRFNFISETADGMGMAHRILQEGNKVRMWIRDLDAVSIGDGLVEKVGDLEDLIHDAERLGDVFIFDTSGNGVLADGLRHQGFAVLGAGVMQDRLEKDRAFALKVMKDCEIDSPPTKSFSSFEDGIEFAKSTKDRMVYKPSKRLGEMSPSLVTSDQGDLIDLLENMKSKISIAKPQFELQNFIEGLEISTEGWFDGSRWLPMFNHTFERKQLMDGNLGPSGGCTGNILWACDGECYVCKKGIRKMERFLRQEDFKGMIDLNAIVTKDDLYGLEFTPRFGYDASPTLFWGLLDGELGQLFADVAMGSNIHTMPFSDSVVAGGIKITIPPWPSERFLADADVPIRGVGEEDYENIYWYNVKTGEGSARYVSAGAWGIIGIALGSGKSVERALREPYRIAEKMRLQNKQYRLDLVKQFEKQMDEYEALNGE